MGLIDRVGPGRVAVDTAAFIYFIEEHPTYLPEVAPLFEQADQGVRELVTSTVTLLELLVVPYRLGDHRLAARYETLLTQSRGIRLVDVSRSQIHLAAQLRASSSVRTSDALQLAAAIEQRCKAFVTNDRRLPAIPGLRIVDFAAQ